jgi:hypothetical protein
MRPALRSTSNDTSLQSPLLHNCAFDSPLVLHRTLRSLFVAAAGMKWKFDGSTALSSAGDISPDGGKGKHSHIEPASGEYSSLAASTASSQFSSHLPASHRHSGSQRIDEDDYAQTGTRPYHCLADGLFRSALTLHHFVSP